MLNKLLCLVVGGKVAQGVLRAKDFVAGRKSYVLGTILLLQGVSCYLESVEGVHGLGDLLKVLRALPDSPCYEKITGGLAIMTLRAGISKSGSASSV